MRFCFKHFSHTFSNMFSFQIFVDSRRELVANSIHTVDADATPTRLNSTVESRRRRRCVLGIMPSKIWKLNILRIYPVELSRVELCRWRVHTRRLSWPSLQFCSVYVTGAENWKLGHDWRLVRTHRWHDATRLRCRQIVQTRHDSSRLSPTSCEFNTHRRQLDSWVASASAVCIGHKT